MNGINDKNMTRKYDQEKLSLCGTLSLIIKHLQTIQIGIAIIYL